MAARRGVGLVAKKKYIGSDWIENYCKAFVGCTAIIR